MLSDEEKKAIELLKMPNADFYYRFIDVRDSVEILLKLIEKQQKEIEKQIEKRENQRQELAILNAKQIEFNKLANTVKSYKGQFKRQQKEIEELKKNPIFLIKDIYSPKLKEINLQDVGGLIEQGREEVRDKIKAKIEELQEDIKYSANPLSIDNSKFGIKILKTLLEKE
jgi:hypothetical protein